jgi:hypothetical protein
VPLLRDEMVEWETLEERYGALLKLVEVLLGVATSSVWGCTCRAAWRNARTALRTRARSRFGAARRPTRWRRRSSAALRDLSAGELTTIAAARSLGRVPCELTAAERDELVDVFGAARAEWIVLGVVMMGFLNKFMNAIGVELEQPIYDEVSQTLGSEWTAGSAGAALDAAAPAKTPPPADGLATKLCVLPLLPTALRLDARWQRGVPRAWPQVGTYVREHTGHDFPVLARLRHRRAIRAIAFMLRENLSAENTVIGLDTKIRCGLVFAEVVADEALAADVRELAGAHGVDPDRTSADPRLPAAPLLARAASPSPAEIDTDVVSACRDSGLAPAAIVELVTWLAVLQMLHRLSCFHGPVPQPI